MRIRYELSAGIFLLVSLALFCVSVFVLGREREIFSELEPYYASFKDVKGLAVGAPVRLGGITVGRVANVGFSSDLNDNNIHVTLMVNDKYLERIKTDSVVTIETQGLLGDRFLNVSPGLSPKQLLPKNNINSDEPGDIGQLASQAGKLMTDGVDIFENVREIFKEVKDGEGLLHSLIFDKSGSKSLGDLSEAARSLSDTAKHVDAIAKEIKDGKGSVHSLIFDSGPSGIGDLVTKLNQVADNLNSASKALSDGSGTLGALLIDPTLYDNLVQVTDEAKRSFLLRQAIKSSLNK